MAVNDVICNISLLFMFLITCTSVYFYAYMENNIQTDENYFYCKNKECILNEKVLSLIVGNSKKSSLVQPGIVFKDPITFELSGIKLVADQDGIVVYNGFPGTRMLTYNKQKEIILIGSFVNDISKDEINKLEAKTTWIGGKKVFRIIDNWIQHSEINVYNNDDVFLSYVTHANISGLSGLQLCSRDFKKTMTFINGDWPIILGSVDPDELGRNNNAFAIVGGDVLLRNVTDLNDLQCVNTPSYTENQDLQMQLRTYVNGQHCGYNTGAKSYTRYILGTNCNKVDSFQVIKDFTDVPENVAQGNYRSFRFTDNCQPPTSQIAATVYKITFFEDLNCNSVHNNLETTVDLQKACSGSYQLICTI